MPCRDCCRRRRLRRAPRRAGGRSPWRIDGGSTTLQWRVHVNGIRGKSTVTRIIAGMMREAGDRDGRQVDGHVRSGDQRATASTSRSTAGDRRRSSSRSRSASSYLRPQVQAPDHRVHGAQARVPGGQRADDRPLEHRRADQRPRGPPGRDGRDAAGDRPLAAVDLPPQRDPRDLRAESGDPRGDARGVRQQGFGADRRRPDGRQRRRHQPLRLHRLQGEHLHRARDRRARRDPT